MGKYAGSMRTRALSGAETIHVNGEVLEYLIQGNQHGYCAVHTPQCRTYGTMPYAVCRMKYAYGSTHPLYYACRNHYLAQKSIRLVGHIK